MKVYTIEEAEKWFLGHSGGTVIAVNSQGIEKECDVYLEAVEHLK